MATHYVMYQHHSTHSKDAVTGFSIVRGNKLVRSWNFSDLKVGSVLTFEFMGYTLTMRITRKRYGMNKRAKSGFHTVKAVIVTASKGSLTVHVPRIFKYNH